MRIENRNLWISVFALFPAVLLGILFNDYQDGGSTREQFIAVAVYCIFLIILMVLLSLGKTIFSEDGITEQYLWIRRHYPWDRVIQVGLVSLDTDPSTKQFAFTFWEGSPWNGEGTLKMWKIKNGKNCLCARYSDELYTLVSKYYGPLDF